MIKITEDNIKQLISNGDVIIWQGGEWLVKHCYWKEECMDLGLAVVMKNNPAVEQVIGNSEVRGGPFLIHKGEEFVEEHQLDWSKAPEGATHCAVGDGMRVKPDGSPYTETCWEKHENGNAYEWLGCTWNLREPCEYTDAHLIPRPQFLDYLPGKFYLPAAQGKTAQEVASLCKQSNMTLSFYGDTIQLFCEDTERQSDERVSIEKAVKIMQAKIAYLDLIEDFI